MSFFWGGGLFFKSFCTCSPLWEQTTVFVVVVMQHETDDWFLNQVSVCWRSCFPVICINSSSQLTVCCSSDSSVCSSYIYKYFNDEKQFYISGFT